LEQIFDHGAPWCINADGHPDYDYPDPELHVPAFECRTAGLAIEAVPDLAGPGHTIEAYVARSFRFGQSRGTSPTDPIRLVLEVTDVDGEIAARFSVGLGDALRLARHVQRLVDLVDQPPVR
jgi:hypothetical protein